MQKVGKRSHIILRKLPPFCIKNILLKIISIPASSPALCNKKYRKQYTHILEGTCRQPCAPAQDPAESQSARAAGTHACRDQLRLLTTASLNETFLKLLTSVCVTTVCFV